VAREPVVRDSGDATSVLRVVSAATFGRQAVGGPGLSYVDSVLSTIFLRHDVGATTITPWRDMNCQRGSVVYGGSSCGLSSLATRILGAHRDAAVENSATVIRYP